MEMDEPKKRKITRLKGADYNRNQAVFLTICTKDRKCILSRVVGTGVLDGPQIELTECEAFREKISPSLVNKKHCKCSAFLFSGRDLTERRVAAREGAEQKN